MMRRREVLKGALAYSLAAVSAEPRAEELGTGESLVRARNAEEAVRLAGEKAVEASAQGTFAVGGLIVENKTGRILVSMHNNVLKPTAQTTFFRPFDPTAHGE